MIELLSGRIFWSIKLPNLLSLGSFGFFMRAGSLVIEVKLNPYSPSNFEAVLFQGIWGLELLKGMSRFFELQLHGCWYQTRVF